MLREQVDAKNVAVDFVYMAEVLLEGGLVVLVVAVELYLGIDA